MIMRRIPIVFLLQEWFATFVHLCASPAFPDHRVFERYHRELVNFLASLVKDSDAAADLAQESFVRVLAVQQAGRVITDPRALLYRTARNLVIDRHRRAAHRDHDDLDSLLEADQPHAPTATRPDHALASAQAVKALVATIEALPSRCREAFLLHTVEGLSHAEIAERMGVSRSAVEKHVVRGLLACRACERSLSEPKACVTEPATAR